jgi:hypothetical protein
MSEVVSVKMSVISRYSLGFAARYGFVFGTFAVFAFVIYADVKICDALYLLPHLYLLPILLSLLNGYLIFDFFTHKRFVWMVVWSVIFLIHFSIRLFLFVYLFWGSNS